MLLKVGKDPDIAPCREYLSHLVTTSYLTFPISLCRCTEQCIPAEPALSAGMLRWVQPPSCLQQ